jgi:tetratricopeptide (TPR) repeat protein
MNPGSKTLLTSFVEHLSESVGFSDEELGRVVDPYRTSSTTELEKKCRIYASTVFNKLPDISAGRASEDATQIFAVTLVSLGRLLADAGKLSAAESLFARAVIIREKWLFEASPMARLAEFTLPLDELARVARNRGQLEVAQRAYTLMRVLMEEVTTKEPQQLTFFVGLALAYQRLSEIALSFGDTTDAERLAKLAEQAMKNVPLTPSPTKPIDTRFLARGALFNSDGLHGQAKVLEARCDAAGALKLFDRRAANIRIAMLIPVIGGIGALEKALAGALCDQARAHRQLAHWAASLAADEDAERRVLLLLPAAKDDPYLLLTQSIALCGQGQAHSELGAMEKALDRLQAALTIAKATATLAPELKPAQRHVGVALSHLAMHQARMGDTATAEVTVRASLAISRGQHLAEPARADREIDMLCNLSQLSRYVSGAEQLALQQELEHRLMALVARGVQHSQLAALRETAVVSEAADE